MLISFYLTNKKDLQIQKSLNELVDIDLENLQNKLVQVNSLNGLDIQRDIENAIEDAKDMLASVIVDIEQFCFCQADNKKIRWLKNENYSNEKEFINFYNLNIEKYEIQDECQNVVTLEEFLKEIHGGVVKVEYTNLEYKGPIEWSSIFFIVILLASLIVSMRLERYYLLSGIMAPIGTISFGMPMLYENHPYRGIVIALLTFGLWMVVFAHL